MANPLCIPQGFGTPDAPGPPNFLQDAAQATLLPSHDLLIRDPRWVGALRLAFSNGASPLGYFRALQSSAGGSPHLYLLWHQTADFDPIPHTDAVWVGFASGAYARVFRVEPFIDLTATAASKTGLQIDSYTLIGGTWTVGAPPAWSQTSTVSWLENPNTSAADWAVAMRVPLVGPGGPDANGIPVNLGDTFKMFFSIVNWTSSPTKTFAETNWPADTGFIPFTNNNENLPTIPLPAVWGDFQVGGAQPCQQGVSIDASQIKVNHPVKQDPNTGLSIDNEILVQVAASAGDPINQQNVDNNIFRATINNATGGAVGQVNATFRLANWGATVADDGQWTEIAVNSTGAATPAGAVLITAKWGDNVTSPISGAFSMQAFLDATKHNADQCMLVELDGANIVFSQDSARTNMLFKKLASPLDTEAEVSARGLGPDPFGTSHRTIYLFVQQLSMPPTFDPQDVRTRRLQSLLWDNQGELGDGGNGGGDGNGGGNGNGEGNGNGGDEGVVGLQARVAPGSSSSGISTGVIDSPWDVLDALIPTYKVHAFYETGAVGFNKGVAFNAIASLSSFGIYANATGPQLFGWDSQLAGAERLSADVWRVRVPNESAVRVTVRLLAKDNPGDTLDHSGETPTALLGGLCLFAQRTLKIGHRVKTLGPTACAGRTHIGADTHSVSVVSAGEVHLRDRASISGSVVSGHGIDFGHGVHVGGGVTTNARVRLPKLALDVSFPHKDHDHVCLERGRTASIDPGAHGDLVVESHATLTLTGGVYRFNSLKLEAHSHVSLKSGGRPVIIYVRRHCAIGGRFIVADGSQPNLFIAVLGHTDVRVDAPFAGTFVVPYGTLRLGTVAQPGFSGAFFAAHLIVESDNTVAFVPFGGAPAIEI